MLQILFYLLFVLLWFKDNFAVLRKIKVPFWVPLLCLIAVSVLLRRPGKWTFLLKPKLKWSKKLTALTIFLALVSLVRVPYFLNSYGLMDSDEAIPALMGKHIAEGKVPPLYFYGALFQGSLPQHYYALPFKIFGFSVFLAKLSAFLMFLAFLVVQFLLIQEVFSFSFALIAGLFYCLPWPHLILASFDLGSGFPVVLFFGSAIFALTYLIYEKDRTHLDGLLGFLSGLAFWTHQISFIFILTISFFLIYKLRFHWQRYLKIGFYFFVGAFPVVLSEIFMGFRLVRLLFSGEAGSTNWQKINRLKDYLAAIVSSGPGYLNLACLILIAGGTIFLILAFLKNPKKRKNPFHLLFAIYILAFASVYLFSDFSNVAVIRYFYILYLGLPVLFGAVFYIIPNIKVRALATGIFFLALFSLGNAKTVFIDFKFLKNVHYQRQQVLQAMEETGEKYWQGEYWLSYLITALSEERLIVASTTVERYPFYRLAYDSEMSHNNFIFLRDNPEAKQAASLLERSLTKFQVGYQKKEIGPWLLLYRILSDVFPINFFFPPEDAPSILLDQIVPSSAGLEARFLTARAMPTYGFHLHLEIPDYCAKSVPLPATPSFEVSIPKPPQDRFPFTYYLDYFGFLIASSRRTAEVELPKEARPPQRGDFEYLRGVGPPVKVANTYRQVCAKEVQIQVNRPLHYSSQIHLFLFSPFSFDDFFWHGCFSQEVSIFVNGQPVLKKSLSYGENFIPLNCRFPPFQSRTNILTLKFKYAQVLSAKDYWKTAAYLSRIATP